MLPEQTSAFSAAPSSNHGDSPAVAQPTAHVAHASEPCANCGATVTDHFCGRCGQRHEHEIHSIWHFTQEVTEDLTHADSRLWSTMLALLFKPGFLTREFLAGKRVRYLPPLRLYLVLSVLFFVVFGSTHHPTQALQLKESNGKRSLALVTPDQDSDLAAKPGESPEQRVNRVCKSDYDGRARRFVAPFIEKGCRQSMLDNGHTISEAMLHNLPRAMFIFLPALAVVMKLMYWRPRRYYVEHLLFFLHTHAFAFALFGTYILLSRIVPAALGAWLTWIVWLYFLYYLFVSMRRVYGQGRFTTLLKFTSLSFTYFIGAVMTLILTVSYSVYAL